MKQLLDSDLELVAESDFIYVPLLFDPEIEKEIQDAKPLENFVRPGVKFLINIEGKHFVRALSLQTLLDNYAVINAYDYKRLRDDCLRKYQIARDVDGILLDGTLRMILFEVMPFFIRKNRGLNRKKLSDEDILDLVGEKINIPQKYHEAAKTLHDVEPLEKILKDLLGQKSTCKLLQNGRLSARQLRDWLHEAVRTRVLASEQDRITKALQVRQQFRRTKLAHIAILLYIADTGGMEIDGFGFTTNNAGKEYIVYRRTGEYVLKDYYGRSYLFPDCRVAISSYTPFWPFVIENYKHPFLLRHKPGQEICMKDFVPPDDLTAKNVIRVIEEGLTALRYGYDGRRRNGYHSLDKTSFYIRTIEFEDYRI